MQKPTLDIVIPVYNNSDVLEKSIKTQLQFYSRNLNDFDWRIVIANNASKDNTLEIAKRLSKKYPEVKCITTEIQGRGWALREAWSKSNAQLLSYMDVDLATDLKSFPQMVRNLTKGYDVSVGSKYLKDSRMQRTALRNFLSRGLNILTKIILGAKFTDAQCGFKSLKKEVANVLLPKVKDNFWFFDTELLFHAQREGMKIIEVPIIWKELGMARKSGVKIAKTVSSFIYKMIELRLKSP